MKAENSTKTGIDYNTTGGNESIIEETVAAPALSQSTSTDPNAAMIKGDLRVSVQHVDKSDEWAAAVAKALTEALQSQVISTAWNRTNRIPRIVGVDPHLPRHE